MKLHMEKCRAGLWVERVEQIAKSWNIRNKGETRDLCCESCSEINMFEIKALSPTSVFLFKNRCMLLHEFKHPWQTCVFFYSAIIRTERWGSWSTRALRFRVRKNTRVHSGVNQRRELKGRRQWMKSCCICAHAAHTSIRIFLKLTTEL